jgi:beta-lactam-binding protein with PASTA domain
VKRIALVLLLLAALVAVQPLSVSTAADPALAGQWSAVLPWPAVGVHAHLLNTGKVLFWEKGTQASLWDPATGAFSAMPNPWVDLLCSGHAVLADGRVITLGGWDRSGISLGLNEVDVFEPNVKAWNRVRPMNFKRWYPTGTRLPDGRVLALSGARNSLTDVVTTPEIYDPAADTWTSLTGAVRSIPLYPFVFVLPDGRVIHLGNSEVSSRTQVLNLATQTWTIIDSRTTIDGGSAVTFAPGKFMKAGTAADSGNSGLAATTAYTLDMTQPTPTWQPTGSMAFPRSFLNLTMLPDGTALATGGGTDRSAFITGNGVLPAEIWSPATGKWTTMASMVTPRLYHSTALLLPDARVLVSGGGSDSGVADQRTAEIFSPPYLFKGARPAITGSPSTVSYGGSFTVNTPDAASIASVALIATGSVTHAFNQNQAYLNLSFTQTANGISVSAPANANLAPPGPYMLFIVNSSGVPSVASMVSLPLGSGPVQVAAPSVVGLTQSAATTAITNAGLTVGTISQASSTTVPAGSVISQNPVAGTQVTSGSAVSLVVSSGPALVAVPNVVNTTQAAATSTITAAGLVVGAVTSASSVTVPAGSVISQAPVAGTQVTAGSAVGLVVSSGPQPPVSVPNVVGLNQTAASNAITSAGLTVGTVSSASSSTVPAGLVISQSPLGGAQAASGSAVSLVISSGPPAAGITVDTVVSVDGNDTVTTPPFDTAAPGELLVAFVASDGSRLSSQQLIVTGAGLTWTLKQRTNEQLGTSEIWTATAPSLLTNVQVTSTQFTGGFDQSLTVVAFAGAGGTGAVGTGNGPTGAPSLVMTTTRAGSLVYGVGNDWDSGTPRNVGTAQVMVHEWVDTAVGDTFWVQARSAPVASAGTAVAINDTLPNTDRWNLSAIEILAGGAGQVAVPNVVGLTQSAATSAITGAGLVVGSVSSSTSTTVPAGSVITQSPLGGSQAAPGSSVALIISSGPPPIAVPDVVGLTQAAASSAITSAGLAVGTIATSSSATVPAGSVISQNPGAGTLVLSGSAVALTVSSGPSQVAVPNVVGLTQTAATSAISAAGLTIGSVNTASSNTVPSGSVISQTPTGGTQVASGTAVSLLVSSGPAQVAVPNVVGLTQTAANSAIIAAGLSRGEGDSTASSTTVPAGSVISQAPAAGTQVTVGSVVALVISTGLPQVAVPSVVGLTQSAATTAITGAGLTVGTVTTATSTTVPAGSVISQSPVGGTQVNIGSAVSLVVSSGLPQVAVPSVVGLTQSAATSAITGVGLTVGTVTTATSTTVPAGSVISQSPVGGTQVNIGSAVSLVVSSGLPQVAVPGVVGLTQSAATTAITGAGLTVGTVTTATSTTVPAGSVISQSPVGDTQVNVGSAVSLVVSSGLPQVAVPSVVGLTQSAATTAITGAGLTVGTVTTATSTTVPAGSVISQSPVGGTQVSVGSAVSLVVSSGLPQVAVPGVVGLTQSAATTAITGAGLTVGSVTTATSTTVPAGSVISQSPVGGTQVNTGSAVSPRRVVRSAAGRGAWRRRPHAECSDDSHHGCGSDRRHGDHRDEHLGGRRIGDQPVARRRHAGEHR